MFKGNELILRSFQILKLTYFKSHLKGEYGGEVVCLNVGMTLNFRCKYQLGEKLVFSDVGVSGHDDSFHAEGQGN